MKETIIDILTKTVEEKQTLIKEAQTIKELLTPLEGKRITVHFQKQLPEGMILEPESEKVYIKIAATGNRHPICYANKKIVDLETLQQLSAFRLKQAKQQLKTPEAILNDPEKKEKIATFYIEVHKAYTQLENWFSQIKNDPDFDSYNNPAHNTILKEIGIPQDIIFSLNKK